MKLGTATSKAHPQPTCEREDPLYYSPKPGFQSLILEYFQVVHLSARLQSCWRGLHLSFTRACNKAVSNGQGLAMVWTKVCVHNDVTRPSLGFLSLSISMTINPVSQVLAAAC